MRRNASVNLSANRYHHRPKTDFFNTIDPLRTPAAQQVVTASLDRLWFAAVRARSKSRTTTALIFPSSASMRGDRGIGQLPRRNLARHQVISQLDRAAVGSGRWRGSVESAGAAAPARTARRVRSLAIVPSHPGLTT